MTTYYDVGQFQKRGEKWTFQRLGSARENDKGGWDVYLNALPLAMDGQCRISIQPQRDAKDDYESKRATGPQDDGRRPDIDDDIPF